MDAGNLLKPMLARGELHCIGATTLDEYRKYIEKDAALERRFQTVFVDQPTRRRHHLDPARPARALRSPSRRAHQGFRAGGRRRPLQSLHLRPLSARQSHRSGRRSRRQAAHRNRLHAGRAGRNPAPHHAARNRARSAEEGDRRRLEGPAEQDREGNGRSESASPTLCKAQWQAEKEGVQKLRDAARADRTGQGSRSNRPSASTI